MLNFDRLKIIKKNKNINFKYGGSISWCDVCPRNSNDPVDRTLLLELFP